MSQEDQNPSRSRSLTRLVIGGLEIGADELLRRLLVWEQETTQALAQKQGAHAPPLGDAREPPQTENQTPGGNPGGASPPEGSGGIARYALIGLIFEMHDNLQRGRTMIGRLERLASRMLDPMLQPLRDNRLLRPARSEFARLVGRGEAEVSRWAARGRHEDAHSRVLAEKAFDDIVDTYIEYLAANPEVQDLVQSQSTGLANEVIEEVRERTVSADTFLEGLARSLMRRVPRGALPEPPAEVRLHASSLRPEKKKKPGER